MSAFHSQRKRPAPVWEPELARRCGCGGSAVVISILAAATASASGTVVGHRTLTGKKRAECRCSFGSGRKRMRVQTSPQRRVCPQGADNRQSGSQSGGTFGCGAKERSRRREPAGFPGNGQVVDPVKRAYVLVFLQAGFLPQGEPEKRSHKYASTAETTAVATVSPVLSLLS
jgi:hypothetical protein